VWLPWACEPCWDGARDEQLPLPCAQRVGSGQVRYALGDRLVDRYLEFVAGRCRPNTLRAVTRASGTITALGWLWVLRACAAGNCCDSEWASESSRRWPARK
jgi:hypothetical protein